MRPCRANLAATIVARCAEAFQVPESDIIMQPRGTEPVTRARRAAAWVLCAGHRFTQAQAAFYLGRSNPCTVGTMLRTSRYDPDFLVQIQPLFLHEKIH